MTIHEKIDCLTPLQRSELLIEIQRPMFELWMAVNDCNWNHMDNTLNELNRRAEIALHEIS
jgi:hypothetical protein